MTDSVDRRRPFIWTEPRIRAAILLAEDEKSDAEIAETVGVSRAALSKWKLRKEFTNRVAQHVAALETAVSRYRIAKRRARVKVLNDVHEGLLTTIAERGEAMAGEIAGGGTGLLVRQTKQIGSGKEATLVTEYQVDTGTLHEMRALQKQAAQELGQWSEKSELAVSGGILREYVIITDHDATPIDPAEIDAFDDAHPQDTG